MEAESNIIELPGADEARSAKLKLKGLALQLYEEAMKLAQARHFHTASMCLERVTRMAPLSGAAHASLASAYWNLGNYDRALLHSQKGRELLDPDDPTPFADAGTLLSSLGRKEEALALLKRAVELQPDNVHAQWAYAIALLDHGEWQAGFEQYECRTQYRGAKYYPKMPFPMWAGEDLADKTLYVQSEQGIGDRILMIRYLSWIKETWPTCRILFLASSPDQIHLESLFYGYREEYSATGFEFLHPQIPWPKADYGCFLGSLPRIHGTRPDNVPPDRGLIRKRMQQEMKLVQVPQPLEPAVKVGITWTGNPAMTRNEDRSIPPELLFELATDPLVQLYSLQFNDDGLARSHARVLICDAAADIDDRGMLGTASVMLNLDLIITCCTANAHLAGALGVPCWTLLCHDPYWIWLRQRNDSVWYPSMRLYRQTAPGDWRGVIERVKPELHSFAEQMLAEGNMKEISHG
jgi:hypothetical protein